jgi:hypothetical protein
MLYMGLQLYLVQKGENINLWCLITGRLSQHLELHEARGHAVEQLVEALCYKPEDRGFDSR